jgi:hypothetical protein
MLDWLIVIKMRRYRVPPLLFIALEQVADLVAAEAALGALEVEHGGPPAVRTLA